MIDIVFDALEELRQEGVTILLVEQNAARAVEFADRAYILRTGRVAHSGTRDEMLADGGLRDRVPGRLSRMALFFQHVIDAITLRLVGTRSTRSASL